MRRTSSTTVTEAASVGTAAKPARPSVWKAFAQPAAWTMFLFGFSSGLPFLLVGGTLSYWLREHGIVLSEITVISSAGMLYVFKFVWAPLLDHRMAPAGFGRLGRRRGWLLLAQLGVIAGLVAMALLTPAQLPSFIAATVAVAFFGATQDIAVDAWRIEIAPPNAQGALVATYTLGYRIALMAAGAFALILADHVRWNMVYLALAALMLVPIAANLHAREPDATGQRPVLPWREAMRHAVADPFVDFFRRYGKQAVLLLALIGLYRISDIVAGVISNVFYADLGFDKKEIADAVKTFGVLMSIAGGFAGGLLAQRYAIMKMMMLGAVLASATNLLFVWLAWAGRDSVLLYLAVGFDNFAAGLAGMVFVAFLSALTNIRFTAVQYALFSSLMTLLPKTLGGYSGGMVNAIGYDGFFTFTALLGVPILALVWLADKRLAVAQRPPQ